MALQNPLSLALFGILVVGNDMPFNTFFLGVIVDAASGTVGWGTTSGGRLLGRLRLFDADAMRSEGSEEVVLRSYAMVVLERDGEGGRDGVSRGLGSLGFGGGCFGSRRL